MEPAEDTPEHHRRRSDFVQKLVQSPCSVRTVHPDYQAGTPRTIVQFWHNRDQIPSDVDVCIESWKLLERCGFTHLLFDRCTARKFIGQRLGARYTTAFDGCYHPAMQSDYFRLCYIFTEGGFYVDADDVYTGINVDHLFNDGRLKLQPLCYDAATESMVPPSVFAQAGRRSPRWIFYFNNNPLIAPAGHPIAERALTMATWRLEQSVNCELPEIQSTTGPGNLTKSIFDLAAERAGIESSLLVMSGWETIGVTKWPLSYRNDSRNWRLSNQRQHQEAGKDPG